MPKSGWHKETKDAAYVALAVAVSLVLLFRFWLRLSLPITAVFAIFGGLLLYEFYGRRRRTISRFFAISTPKAQKKVRKILQEKNIPFTLSKDRFLLTDNNIVLRVTHFHTTRSGKKGTFISLRPFGKASLPLLYSLQEKIDDAFADKAL
ncbi:MAG: hypothetical protein GY805_35380 [Chloroflexi bacterium]|nr:hypothetical protein [Chloroflexota bacterium]